MIGELYRGGVLRGKFETNETYLVTDWYVRDIEAAHDDTARYFFRVDDAPRGAALPPDLEQRFHPWGEVRVHGVTRIRVYEQNDYARIAPRVFDAETFPLADSTLLARSLLYRQAKGDDRAFRELGQYLDANLTAEDKLLLDSPLQDGILPYYYRGAANIEPWSPQGDVMRSGSLPPRVYASLWGSGDAEHGRMTFSELCHRIDHTDLAFGCGDSHQRPASCHGRPDNYGDHHNHEQWSKSCCKR